MTPLLQRVRLLLIEGEGKPVNHMYRDTNKQGLITIGIGCQLFGPDDAAKYYFVHRDDENKKATTEEIKVEYANTLKLAHGNYKARWYGLKDPDTQKYRTTLLMPDEEIDRLFYERLNKSLKEVQKYKGFNDLPLEVQIALLDMDYNLGWGGLHYSRYKPMHDAIKNKDWVTAAKYSSRTGISPQRNAATKRLFLEAATHTCIAPSPLAGSKSHKPHSGHDKHGSKHKKSLTSNHNQPVKPLSGHKNSTIKPLSHTH